MLYVGMDVHWKTTSICIMNEMCQKVKATRIDGSWKAVLGFLGRIDEPFAVVFEASCGYGFLYDRLTAMKQVRRVVVAHPGQLRLIFRSKRKNDRIDAGKLAVLLRMDMIPEAYVPSVEIRQWRELIEYRQAVVARVVRCKNGLRALLRGQGIVSPKYLWTRKGLAWLAEQSLPEVTDLRREMLLEELEMLTGQLKRVTGTLDKIARRSPSVQLLETIPGVGPRTAETMAAYIADANRFHRNRSIGTYLGLVPCQDASAGKNRLGHITKDGPATARKVLVEASWQVIRRCPRTKARFERICQGKPDRRKKALVAVARHLACCMLSMLQTGEVWREAA